jgi:hypothetical protein
MKFFFEAGFYLLLDIILGQAKLVLVKVVQARLNLVLDEIFF